MNEELKELIAEEQGLIYCVFGGYVSCEKCTCDCEQFEEYMKYQEIEYQELEAKSMSLFDVTKEEYKSNLLQIFPNEYVEQIELPI